VGRQIQAFSTAQVLVKSPLAWSKPAGVGVDVALPRLAAGGSVRTIFGQSFDVGELHANIRATTDVGKQRVKYIRDNLKRVPSVLYGRSTKGEEDAVLLTVDALELAAEMRKRGPTFTNTLYKLYVNNVPMDMLVIPKEVNVHPITDRVQSVVFMRYRPNARPGVKCDIPLRAINEDKCPGIKDGGWLLFLNYTLPVWVRGDTVPNCLIVDLRGKKIAEKIRVSEIHFNEGIRLRTTRTDDFSVAKIVGSKKLMGQEDDTTTAATGAPAAAAPAAGKAPSTAAKVAEKKAATPAAPAPAKKK